jgi:uncharacterized protein (DUF1810 family)
MRSECPSEDNPNHLQRFVGAQAQVFDAVTAELQAGHKRTHWIWFVFPQLRGLGRSHMAHRYGISGLHEAIAYLQHPLLGARLRECTQLVLNVKGRSAVQILGSPDDLKFRSSMTLFAHATAANEIFVEALNVYFSGVEDRLTLDALNRLHGQGLGR